ncbi:MAG: flagellar filament capping protein FliD [Dehalococcoidia bacterium]
MATVSLAGIISGIDTRSIVDQIIAARSQPILRLEARIKKQDNRQDTLTTLRSSFATLLGRVKSLSSASSLNARSTNVTRTATGDRRVVSVSADSTAALGAFRFSVEQLATTTKVGQETQLDAGSEIAGGTAIDNNTVSALNVAGAEAGTTYTFTYDAATDALTLTNGTTNVAQTITLVADTSGDKLLDFSQLGVSLTLTGPAESSADAIGNALAAAGTNDIITQADAIGQAIDANALLDVAGFATTIELGTFTIQGNATATITIDGTDTLNSVIGKINAQTGTTGITATLVGGNRLQLDSGGGPNVVLGAGGDTSNFLQATHLLAAPGTTNRVSTRGLGQALAGGNLQDARLATALTQTTGSFTINGVSISYDAVNQSLNDILGEINNSDADVTALYDATTDRVTFTAKATGSSAISFVDVTGNFLEAIKILDGAGAVVASETLGANAAYKINDGATQYSSTNTVSDAVPGVTLTLREAAPGDNATVTIAANDTSVVSAVGDFVEQFNSTMTLLTDALKTDPDSDDDGDFSGDSNFRMLVRTLRSRVIGLGDNLPGKFTSLADVGLSFGSVGAEVGTTEVLELDAAKLREALTEDRDAVVQLFSALTVAAGPVSGTGSILSATGAPDSLVAGTYTIVDDGLGNLTLTIDPEDGSPSSTRESTITAGGTNNTLIAGMTLTAKGTLQAGTDTFVVTRDQVGVAVKLDDLLDAQLRKDGALDAKDENITDLIEDMNDRIEVLEARLTAEQIRLERKFALMEQAFARFEAQRGFLEAFSSQLLSVRRRR